MIGILATRMARYWRHGRCLGWWRHIGRDSKEAVYELLVLIELTRAGEIGLLDALDVPVGVLAATLLFIHYAVRSTRSGNNHLSEVDFLWQFSPFLDGSAVLASTTPLAHILD